MSTHNLCFEKKYDKYQNFLSKFFPFLVVTFSIYLSRRVFVMFSLYVQKAHKKRSVIVHAKVSVLTCQFIIFYQRKISLCKFI